MARYVALLRGVNLAGKRRVGMGELRSVLQGAGYGDVRTLAQSGNVVLTSEAGRERLEHDLAALLGEAFGFEIAVMARTRDELAEVLANDPFAGETDDPARYQVSFLAGEPEPDRVAQLEDAAEPPERVAIRGREVYAWHPGGVGRSELAKLISERHLGVGVTARNRRTLTKLLDLASVDGN